LDPSSISRLLSTQFPQCDVSVEGGDGKYLVTVVGNIFEGLNAVKRQQKVYQVLNDSISSGDIHAVSMRLFTPDEIPG
jgi:acid stress-induced BolA-like protein IbaG/YrbA